MKYNYVASKKDGTLKKGSRQSASEEDLRKALLKEGLNPVEITPDNAFFAFFHKLRGLLNKQVVYSVSLLDKALFTKHLSIILESGLNLEEGLSIAKEQSRVSLRRILTVVEDSVQGGIKLADALAQYPKIFPAYFQNIIRIGEESGNLSTNLKHLSEQLFKEIRVRKNIQGAMIYPGIILSLVVIMGVGIVVFILPRVLGLFTSIDVELPLITRILLDIAQFSADYALFILLGVLVLVVILRLLWQVENVRYLFQRFFLMIPIINKLIKNANLAKFSRSLASLIASGIPIVEALKSLAEATDNLVYQRSLKKIVKEAEKGFELAEVMSTEEKLFPKITFRLIRVGESTGRLEDVLTNLADYYENEVDLASKNLTVLIEPLLLIFVAFAVGLLAIAILLPIYMFTTSVGSV